MKAQMEIMGLAVIMILLSLGFVITLAFIVDNKGGPDNREEYEQSELASDFLNTLMDTNPGDCPRAKFRELFIDCARNEGYGGDIICGGSASCDFIANKVPSIFSQTFDVWKRDYFFGMTHESDPKSDSDYLIEMNNYCPNGRKRATQPYSTGAGDSVLIVLDICT